MLEAEDMEPETEICEVWPENAEAVNVFLGLSTQWRVIAGFGSLVRQGLDYTSVESMLRMMKIKNRSEMLARLQIMEAAALEVING